MLSSIHSYCGRFIRLNSIKTGRMLLSSSTVTAPSLSTSSTSLSTTTTQHPVPNVVSLSELKIDKPYTNEQFAKCIRPYYEQNRPVKFSTQHNNFTYNSNASAKWLSLDYLLETVGPNYPCDVESMTSRLVRERMTIDFIDYIEYLKNAKEHSDLYHSIHPIPSDEIMYMAQNDIPPVLLPDISIPGFCYDHQYQVGEGKLYSTMIWIGPQDCISRLHYDPLDNILMQIIGTKRIYLIDKTVSTDLLYVDTSVYQEHNMSNIENIEEEIALLSHDPNNITKEWKTKQSPTIIPSNYTNLLQVPIIYETILYPGDLLYIPSKWWHAVRSLEYSISVNTWWR